MLEKGYLVMPKRKPRPVTVSAPAKGRSKTRGRRFLYGCTVPGGSCVDAVT